jgi:HD-GYP domain-containing protein (c-di-GMP phosphodiesterase class II)
MTSNRSYRKALFKEEALRRIARMSGTQFRPELVAIFLELMENNHVQDAPLSVVGAI